MYGTLLHSMNLKHAASQNASFVFYHSKTETQF